MGYIDKNILLSIITKEDVIKILYDLGSTNFRTDSNGDLIFQSVCHNSNSYKLYYYHEPTDEEHKGRIFHCYSKCGESFQIFELVIRVNRIRGKSLTFYQSISYVANMIGYIDTGVPSIATSQAPISDWDWIDLINKKNDKEIPILPEYNEHILETFCYYPHKEFLEDGINMETLSEFEIGYFGRDNAITIPHRDIDRRLIGIRQRHLDPLDIENYGKYCPVMIEDKILRHKLGSNLYGIHINKNTIQRCKKVLIVESEKSVMQNHSMFQEDDYSLATCGSSISEIQRIILLRNLGIQEIILGYDKEFTDPESFEADLYRNKLLRRLAPFLNYCKVSLLWDKNGYLNYKDSPTDKGKDTLLALLDEKITITQKDLELLNSK